MDPVGFVAMFIPGADYIVDRGSAPWKLGLIAVAGLNIALFHRGALENVRAWDVQAATPVSA